MVGVGGKVPHKYKLAYYFHLLLSCSGVLCSGYKSMYKKWQVWLYGSLFTYSCTSLSWLTEEKIFLVPTLTATWENEIFPQKCRETSSCWAGAQETQQPSLPTTSCTPIAWLYLHHLRRGGRVVSAHQSDCGCHKGDLLFKWIWRVVIFLWMKKRFALSAVGRHRALLLLRTSHAHIHNSI